VALRAGPYLIRSQDGLLGTEVERFDLPRGVATLFQPSHRRLNMLTQTAKDEAFRGNIVTYGPL
jgi:hypothetical protein